MGVKLNKGQFIFYHQVTKPNFFQPMDDVCSEFTILKKSIISNKNLLHRIVNTYTYTVEYTEQVILII